MKFIASFKKFALMFFIVILFVSCNNGSEFEVASDQNFITIATFNCEWLGDGIDDINIRTAEDYENIAKVLADTKSDLIALQEVENSQALDIIIKHLPDYKYVCGENGGKQNLAFLFNEDIKLTQIHEYMPLVLEANQTRPGLVAYCKKNNLDFWIMNVHLKSTSRYDSTDYLKQKSYEIRTRQAEILNNWVDSILAHSERDIIILGDFNDNPNKKANPTLSVLAGNTNIEFQTEDFNSCKNYYWDAIDHIINSKNLNKRILTGSIMMFDTYNFYGKEKAERISDHCPVMITYEVKSPDDD